jgi:hypothetical protein
MQLHADHNPPFGELAMAYERGLLTPFTGAGLSRETCPDWARFVDDLEAAAVVKGDGGKTSAELIRRAWRAVRVLRHQGSTALEQAVRHSLYGKLDAGQCAVPAQTRALADLWWPLVLTTNYDSLFLDAWNERWVKPDDPIPDFNRMTVLGRGRADCQRVLNANRGPDNPLLWALQGFLSHHRDGTGQTLLDQITIGHEEYRRQTHEAVHFRRAFAEIYRSRVLLFIGSGLQEGYLLDLFGETLELLGSIGHFHYALVKKDTTDPAFLRRRLQIRAIEYEPPEAEKHAACVEKFLAGLKQAIEGLRPRSPMWALTLKASATISKEERPDIVVVRAKLRLRDGDTVAVSAGLREGHTPEQPRPHPGRVARKALSGLGLDLADLPLRQVERYVYRVEGHPVYIVAARDPDLTKRKARDARHVGPAVEELMAAAAADGCKRVNAMLFAAGERRTFPQYLSLYGMVKGYCDWHRKAAAKPAIPLYIHVVDPSVIGLLASRRIDLAVMAGSLEVRYWIEIRFDDEGAAPELDIASIDSTVVDVMNEYAIPSTGWNVSVRPAPTKTHKCMAVEEVRAEQPPLTLGQFGVLNGSTLIFARSQSKG